MMAEQTPLLDYTDLTPNSFPDLVTPMPAPLDAIPSVTTFFHTLATAEKTAGQMNRKMSNLIGE
jgi:hypothetical protein